MDLFNSITPYHWLAFGLLLLTAEMLGAAGFLLGAAAAAIGMGALLWFVPDMSVAMQIVIFSAMAIAATIVYFRLFRDAQKHQGRPMLNKRARRLIGHQFKLDQDVELGHAKIQIGDTLWRVKSDQVLSEGTLVEVVEARRMTLVIAAKESPL